ncbi:MAG: hypothetical protein JNL50_09655 [Phycisphaerae bacterium]|nr:hypothetical protein [Phycisphaerae bacterium]
MQQPGGFADSERSPEQRLVLRLFTLAALVTSLLLIAQDAILLVESVHTQMTQGFSGGMTYSAAMLALMYAGSDPSWLAENATNVVLSLRVLISVGVAASMVLFLSGRRCAMAV